MNLALLAVSNLDRSTWATALIYTTIIFVTEYEGVRIAELCFYFSPRLDESSLMRLLMLSSALLVPWVTINAAEDSQSSSVIKKTLRTGEPAEADLQRARAVLNAWENEDSQRSPRVMRIVYWSPSDREPQPEFRSRLTR